VTSVPGSLCAMSTTASDSIELSFELYPEKVETPTIAPSLRILSFGQVE
jgi:hypothetical protein